MAARRRTSVAGVGVGRSTGVALALLVTILLAPLLGGEPALRQEEEKPATPKPEARHHSMTVTVVAKGTEGAESPVKGATVTVFVGDREEAKTTNGAGRASFAFDTDAEAATVRVVAERLNPDQKQVSLKSREVQHKVVLTAEE